MTVNWHERYQQQASWTRELRNYVRQQIHLPPDARILEVGAGTGALLAETAHWSSRPIHGIDRAAARLREAAVHAPGSLLTQSDAHHLPYANGSFDLTYCHFFLLWASNPAAVLREMRRVTRPGGYVVAFAEPDYLSRIDHPDTYRAIGAAQRNALQAKNANPDIGRHLGEYFHRAGIPLQQAGIIGSVWDGKPDYTSWRLEWDVLRYDLQDFLSPTTLETLSQQDWQDRQRGIRVLFVPVFFAWGQV